MKNPTGNRIPDAETYWERRALLHEQILREVLILLGSAQPEIQEHLISLADARDQAKLALDEEFTVPTDEPKH